MRYTFRRWTKEEELYLEESWGWRTMRTMAEELGRTQKSIDEKASEMKLGRAKDASDKITLNTLAKLVKRDSNTVYSWCKLHGLKYKERTFGKQKFLMISVPNFWAWANVNRHRVDFSKIEIDDLTPHPAWVQEERRKRKLSQSWTGWQEVMLKSMIKQPGVTYEQIEEVIGKSESSVRNKLGRLGIVTRPLTGRPDRRTKEGKVAK